ncbi:MAG TPA: KH domain-containing protein [Thermotogota bacterium]|nr:KH domain-containing protein [Thermotogota bacterium]HPJ88912.1 KH domain-containing protein [Thermotogota bacterium]HPR95292.1 KH domain-containing protein [Thermotogota bacterium]
MKDALETIVKGIVKHPQEVEIISTEEDGNVVFELLLNKEDVGQIIGKNGRTIKSINILLNSLAGARNEKFILKVKR